VRGSRKTASKKPKKRGGGGEPRVQKRLTEGRPSASRLLGATRCAPKGDSITKKGTKGKQKRISKKKQTGRKRESKSVTPKWVQGVIKGKGKGGGKKISGNPRREQRGAVEHVAAGGARPTWGTPALLGDWAG